MFDHHSLFRSAMLLLVLVFAAPNTVAAQRVASSLDQLRKLVKVGDDVIVTDVHHRQTRGRIAAMSSTSLGLVVDGTRIDVPESDLDTISTRDSRWNGTVWGLGVGAVLGAWLDRDLVRAYGREDISVGESALFIAQAAGGGAAIGFAVDAILDGRRVIYSRSRTSTSATVLPLWGHGRMGVVLSVHFR